MSPDLLLVVCPSPAAPPATRAERPAADAAACATAGEAPPPEDSPFGDLLARLSGKGRAAPHDAGRGTERPPEVPADGDDGAVPDPVPVVVPLVAFPAPTASTGDVVGSLVPPAAETGGDEAASDVSEAGPLGDESRGAGELAGVATALPLTVPAADAGLPTPAAAQPMEGAAQRDALPTAARPAEAHLAAPDAAAADAPEPLPKGPGAGASAAEAARAALADAGSDAAHQPWQRPAVSTVFRSLDVAHPADPGLAMRLAPLPVGASVTGRGLRSAATAARLVTQLDGLPAGEARTGGITGPVGRVLAAGTWASDAPATEALTALVENEQGGGAAGALRTTAARRLEASLLRALDQATQPTAWRVPTLSVAGREPASQADGPSPGSMGTALGSDAWAAAPAPSMPAATTATGASAATDASSPGTESDVHAVVPQVVKAIRLQWTRGLGEARIRLEPEHLGEVHVSMRVQGGAVTAVVKAENPTVQAWIETRQQELRDSLGEQGLRLQRFEVVVDPEGRRQARAPQEAAPRRQRRGAAGQAEFEVPIQS